MFFANFFTIILLLRSVEDISRLTKTSFIVFQLKEDRTHYVPVGLANHGGIPGSLIVPLLLHGESEDMFDLLAPLVRIINTI